MTMRQKLPWRLLAVAVGLLVACSDDDRDEPTDSGTYRDAAGDAGSPVADAGDGGDASSPADAGDAATAPDQCRPSADLVDRVDPDRLLSDLQFLVGLGERVSHAAQMTAADYIRTELVELGGVEVTDIPYRHDGEDYVDIEAAILGREQPTEIVLLAAHFDSTSSSADRAPGADDDASGVAAVLEVARVMAGCAPTRSIRMLFSSNEEVGLVGAEAYLSWIRDSVSTTDLIGLINAEMIAFGPADEDVDLVGRPGDEALALAIVDAIETWTPIGATTALDNRSSCGDESAFRSDGYAALCLISDWPFENPYYHSPDDTLDTLNLAFHADVTRGLVAAAAVLANP